MAKTQSDTVLIGDAQAPVAVESSAPPTDLVSAMVAALNRQSDILAALATRTDQSGMTAEQVEKIVSSLASTRAESDNRFEQLVKANRQTTPNNPDHLHVSVFSYPEGDLARPKPAMKRRIRMNGFEERSDALTPFEIDSYNKLSDSLPHAESKRLARDGRWSATVSRDNQIIDVVVPAKTMEDRAEIPNGLALVIRELMDGAQAVDPQFLLAQADLVRDLQTQLAELRASVGR